jgi:phenylacetate-CoA ligase
MSKESMLSFVRDWNRVKPPQLQGYVGAMVELAQFVDDSNIEFNKPEVVWVTSAPLSKVQRSLLERVFRAPVYDQYGCCELPWIAAQCEVKQYLHVNAEIVGLEFVDDNNKEVKSGEWGRLLLTRFYDLTFPIIRYEVGDNGRFVNFRCSCDRTLPLIDSIKGRTTDTIRLPSGRILSGDYLTTIFDDFPSAVSSFQVVQKRDSSLVVRYVASEPDSIDNVISKIKKTLEGKVNSEVSVSFKRVNEIRHERGKLRFVVKE